MANAECHLWRHAMIVRSPILAPQPDGAVRLIRDGVIASDASGRIEWIGEFSHFPGVDRADIRASAGVIIPPLFDNHIHIPQHPIRGHFLDGVDESSSPHGRLIAGLERNVFPAEARCEDSAIADAIIHQFLHDTLAHGVVGGAAYMTVHAAATHRALQILPPSWSVGLVMMNQNCPAYLRTDEANLERDYQRLASDFGQRVIVTDRFALAVDAPLRRRGVALAQQFSLRTQTHLNEQRGEKRLVEEKLYPGLTYAGVYERDDLLSHRAILAHCVHMSEPELRILKNNGAAVAHCPVSNTLLGSGIMPLDAIIDRGIDYAICTDVGASPTTSILNEMAQFLKAHAGRSRRATPSEALFRSTLGAARMMGLDDRFGQLAVGRPMSFVEVRCTPESIRSPGSTDEAIAAALLDWTGEDDKRYASGELRDALDRLASGAIDAGAMRLLEEDVEQTVRRVDAKVVRVAIDGKLVFER
jgi:guanine deaminase